MPIILLQFTISAVLLLATSATFTISTSTDKKYMKVGHTTDLECPAHLILEADFVPNPAFTVSPDQALILSKISCPNKRVVTVFSDSENYYIPSLGNPPGTKYTRVVNGRNGKVSIIENE